LHIFGVTGHLKDRQLSTLQSISTEAKG